MSKKREYDIGCVPSTFWFGFVGSNILVPIIALLSGIKVKPDKRFLEAEGPIILIANHESFLDPMVTSRLTHGRKVNFVCGEFLFRAHFWGHVFKLGGAIPKKQFAVDAGAVKAMMKVMKRGGVLVIYPEATRHVDGHTTDLFDDGVAKLAKKAGASVFVQHIHGAYMSLPRWCPKIRLRRGRITSEFVKIITREEIAGMSTAELDSAIKEAICYDENRWVRDNNMVYRGRNLAEGLQNVAYKCPVCLKDFTLEWKGPKDGNAIRCSCCSTDYRYSPDGTITFIKDGIDRPIDLHQWSEWEKEELRKELEDVVVETDGDLYKVKDQFNFYKHCSGHLTVRKGIINYVCEDGLKLDFEMGNLKGIVCDYGKFFEVYDNKGELYRFMIPGNMVYKIQQIVELCGRYSHE